MPAPRAAQWQPIELSFTGPALDNPYTDLDATVIFTHSGGATVSRPLFWDGDRTWRARFASTHADGAWTWRVRTDTGHELAPDSGELLAGPSEPGHAHPALSHGLLRPADSRRALCLADGTPYFLVIDTAWGLPWRASTADVLEYARDRADKGFNAALLMSVQPDTRAAGPRDRSADEGFDVGFEDLPDGRLTKINHDYFRTLDGLLSILVAHGITPILQPVFQGFGWKGLDVAGTVAPPAEYARYARYLVARYGASPVIYLPCGDGTGTEPQVAAAGEEIEACDAYGQPTGIHYRPHHRNDVHQAADWLDFQSCQTGHAGDHVPDRVARMWTQRPVKAVINGEPSYEHTGRHGVAEGWWQGHEAWSNLCAGALTGVAYGAASLWQWRHHAAEPGHPPYFLAADAGWREALAFEGSRYVGLVGRIVAGLPLAEAEPCWDVSLNSRGLLVPGRLYLGYAEHGGPWMFLDSGGRIPSRYWMIDPRTGVVISSGRTPPDRVPIENDDLGPSILICSETTPLIARRSDVRNSVDDVAG
jgi:hypothetical protein